MSLDQLNEWHHHLKEANEDCLVAVVGNKSDLQEARSVSLQQGIEKQKQLGGFMHIETSSYTDVDSITYLFKRIAEEICRKRRFTKPLGNRLSKHLH